MTLEYLKGHIFVTRANYGRKNNEEKRTTKEEYMTAENGSIQGLSIAQLEGYIFALKDRKEMLEFEIERYEEALNLRKGFEQQADED